jgi:large subunit ribosomal protein L18
MAATNSLSLFRRRQRRTRFQIQKKAGGRIRLSVHRSNQHIYAQLIDDVNGKTLASASTVDKEVGELKSTSNIEAAKKVGALIAVRGKKLKVTSVVFDRGGYIYHGRVKALADAARENGLEF